MDGRFKGIFPALLTPFDRDDNINKQALAQLIERNIRAGVSGFYVAGSTAEVFMLTESERYQVYETVAEVAGGRVRLIAHIGAISTKQAVEYGRLAGSLGYDAVSAVPPFYYKFTKEQIRRHYFTIASEVGLPVLLYNFPDNSGVSFGFEDFAGFLKNPEFIGLKHTSSDYFMLQRIKEAFPDKLVYNGYDEMFICGLATGCDGGVGSTYNFMADKFIRMMEKYQKGDTAGAYTEQRVVNRIIGTLKKVGVMEGTKELLCQLGIDCGRARSPYSVLGEQERRFIAAEVLPLL
ncbi:MAG TPA: N-acetylneuraminate lyase [Clostridiales bacterium]|jgi:N-acetylneuraminate lyase|nr:N-acetylneuraminate lyase [Clostridiales bacterium]